MVPRDGRVRCFTRNGHDWADRFTGIVDAARRIKAASFLIDGEAVTARDDGRRTSMRYVAFDLIDMTATCADCR
jgi:ATP-dependent DNA ligase